VSHSNLFTFLFGICVGNTNAFIGRTYRARSISNGLANMNIPKQKVRFECDMTWNFSAQYWFSPRFRNFQLSVLKIAFSISYVLSFVAKHRMTGNLCVVSLYLSKNGMTWHPKTPPACWSPERENLASLNLTLVLSLSYSNSCAQRITYRRQACRFLRFD